MLSQHSCSQRIVHSQILHRYTNLKLIYERRADPTGGVVLACYTTLVLLGGNTMRGMLGILL